MFLRQLGRQVLVLHSYRDGTGKVRQRCLGRARSRQEWCELEGRLAQEGERLRPRALELLGESGGEVRRRDQLEKMAAALLRLLAEGEVPTPSLELLRLRLSGEGGEASQRERSRLSPRRKRFDPTEEEARPYLRALEEEAVGLQGQGSACLEVRRERAQTCRDLQGHTDYAWELGRQGRWGLGAEAMLELPLGDAWSNFNRAALGWQQGELGSCLHHLFRGLARDPRMLLDLQKGRGREVASPYWEQYGERWGESGRRFLLWVGEFQKVRYQLWRVARQGVRMRTLVKAHSCKILLEKLHKDVVGSSQ